MGRLPKAEAERRALREEVRTEIVALLSAWDAQLDQRLPDWRKIGAGELVRVLYSELGEFLARKLEATP